MFFEDILPLVRKGGKFKRPYMNSCYIMAAVLPVKIIGVPPKYVLVLQSQRGVHAQFTLSGEDLYADDWEDAEPIVKAKMYATAYSVRCPSCTRPYSAGADWTSRVGDVYKCSCGNRILIEPPVEYEPTADVKCGTISAVDKWPRA